MKKPIDVSVQKTDQEQANDILDAMKYMNDSLQEAYYGKVNVDDCDAWTNGTVFFPTGPTSSIKNPDMLGHGTPQPVRSEPPPVLSQPIYDEYMSKYCLDEY